VWVALYLSKFYPRLINNTNITLSKEEVALFNRGLKYNLNFKHKNWITTLALEAEPPINQLIILEHQVPNNIKNYIYMI
jgi:hypothetical protein